ncbi:MAG: alpha/beta fold hydrolase [Bacteroidaceae bacterium]|nr:alpha/beta fold hydrolase [Bacteroidaceae bacterium]
MDIEHYYIEKGRGEPLILLHGNGENCDYFKGQIDEFARYYHVYALDTRGHGNTPRGNAPFTIRQFADDLLGFMDSHGIDKAHLLGFYDGGNIAAIKAKTLVIAGNNDMIKDAHTRLIAHSIQDSQLVLIKGNHFIANKCPEAFNRAVLEFLNS